MSLNLKLGSQHEKHMWMRLNFFQWLTFSFFKTAQGKDGVAPPISLHERESAAPAQEYFQAIWASEMRNAHKDGREASLMRALFRAYGTRFMCMGIWKVAHSACIWFAAFYLIRSLILYAGLTAVTGLGVAYGYALGIIGAAVGQTFCLNQMQSGCASLGISIKAALSSLVYRKMMRLNGTEGVGEVVNLIARECDRVVDGCLYFHYLWAAFPECATVLALVGSAIGVWVLPGFGVLAIALPAQCMFGYFTNKMQEQLTETISQRVGMMGGILDAIKIVKYNGWELFFINAIQKFRDLEQGYLSKITTFRTLSFVFSFNTPMLVALACFGTYYQYSGIPIVAVTSFTILNVSNSLRYPLFLMPTSTKCVTGAVVAIRNIRNYLLLEEVSGAKNLDELADSVNTLPVIQAPVEQKLSAVSVKNVTFSWGVSAQPEVRDISFDIKGIHLLAVVGPLAAGKSSLMAGLTKQISCLSGSVAITGRTAYVSQQPWLYNATLRDNILFGSPMNETRYQEVIRVCALQRDLELLPNGDLTEIAERGTNLSGGQRQRVNLARAVYSDYEVFLLDDPLSAVDQKVGRHIFQECVKSFLRNKLVIFVTHQMQYLEQCDSVLVVNGTQVDLGSYSELMGRCELLKDMVGHGGHDSADDADEEEPSGIIKTDTEIASMVHTNREEVARFENAPTRARISSITRPMPVISTDKSMSEGTENPYKYYMRSYGSYWSWFCVTFVFVSAYAIRLGSDAWITMWTRNQFAQPNGFYIGIYGAFVVGFIIWVYTRGHSFSFLSLRTSEAMHNRALNRIMRGTMQFFYSTPLARLVALFSSDQERVDDTMPDSLLQILQYVPLLAATMCLICVYMPYATILSAALIGFTLLIAWSTNDSIYAIKQQEAISRPYTLTHVTATVQGLQTIRAMCVEKTFVETFNGRLDRSNNFWNCLFHAQLWQAMQLDMLTSVYVFLVTILAIYWCQFPTNGLGIGGVTPANLGLIVSCAMQTVVFVGWSTRAFSETRERFSSVQTNAFYATQTPQETPFTIAETKPPADWPVKATIKYENAVLHYNRNAEPVLRNVSFEIKDKEKIGIVGRTGAGKSTLLNSFLRIFELSSGRMYLDGIDISILGLHDLRTKIAVIPQEPVLFSGTLRSNLDPFGKYTDDQLWDALRRVHLDEYASNQVLKLNCPIAEYGLNLSLGQRQLICIARVLLFNAKILFMDEATASIDMVSDSMLQDTVRELFKDCTVLTIAHRLRTVIDSDRIMVMEAGQVVEFDVPSVLLRNEKSALSAFVSQTGLATAAYLRGLADNAYRKQRRLLGLSGTISSPHSPLPSPHVSPLIASVPAPVARDSPAPSDNQPLIVHDRGSTSVEEVAIDIARERKE